MWTRRAIFGAAVVVASTVGTVAALPAPAVDGPATTRQPAVRTLQPIPGDQPMCSGRPMFDATADSTVRLMQFDGNTADDPLIAITDVATGQPKPVNWSRVHTSAYCDVMFFPDVSYDSGSNRIKGFGWVDLLTATYEFVATDYEYGAIFPTIWGFVEVVESGNTIELIDVFSDEVIYGFTIPSGYRVADVALDAYSVALIPTSVTPAYPNGNTFRDPLVVVHAEREAPFVISNCLALDPYARVGFSPSGNLIHFVSPCSSPGKVDGSVATTPFSDKVHVADAWSGSSRAIEVSWLGLASRRLLTDNRLILCGDGMYDWTLGSPPQTLHPPDGFLGDDRCRSVR